MILNIKPQFTADYIANLLWKRGIAKVSSITFIPEIKNGEISHIAYINIDSFCETKEAADFIHNIASDLFVFCHNEQDVDNTDSFWVLEKNTHNSGNLYVGPYTTIFTSDFFEPKIVKTTILSFGQNLSPQHEDVPQCETEEFSFQRPIKGLDNDYHTVEEALEILSLLNEHLENESAFSNRLKLEEEFEHFESEIKKWENTYGIKLAEEAEKNDTSLSMGELCPSLFIPYSHKMKREQAGEWCKNDCLAPDQKTQEIALSAEEFEESSLYMIPPLPASRREVAMSVEEYLASNLVPPVLRREVALSNEEISKLLNSR